MMGIESDQGLDPKIINFSNRKALRPLTDEEIVRATRKVYWELVKGMDLGERPLRNILKFRKRA